VKNVYTAGTKGNTDELASMATFGTGLAAEQANPQVLAHCIEEAAYAGLEELLLSNPVVDDVAVFITAQI
jgi:hypothetical protein